jgi:hypothetical protein
VDDERAANDVARPRVQASVYRGAPNLVWGGWCGPVDGTDLHLV